MLSSRLMLCARDIMHDDRKNTINVYAILEDISGLSYPLFLQQIDVLNVLGKDDSDEDIHDCLLKILLDDSLINEIPFKVNFFGEKKTRVVNTFNGLMIPSSGILKFEFHSNERLISSYIINASLIEAE